MSKKTKRRRGKSRPQPLPTHRDAPQAEQSAQRPADETTKVTLQTIFGPVETTKEALSAVSARRTPSVDFGRDDDRPEHGLSACQHRLMYLSAYLVRMMLIVGERLPPRATDRLLATVPDVIPGLVLTGPREVMLMAAPILRRATGIELYYNDLRAVSLCARRLELPWLWLTDVPRGKEADAHASTFLEYRDQAPSMVVVLVAEDGIGRAQDVLPPEAIIAVHEVEFEYDR